MIGCLPTAIGQLHLVAIRQKHLLYYPLTHPPSQHLNLRPSQPSPRFAKVRLQHKESIEQTHHLIVSFKQKVCICGITMRSKYLNFPFFLPKVFKQLRYHLPPQGCHIISRPPPMFTSQRTDVQLDGWISGVENFAFLPACNLTCLHFLRACIFTCLVDEPRFRRWLVLTR